MKLGKRARIFLASGIFVVLAASLGMAYLQQGQEQSRLSQELSSVQLLLEKQSAKLLPEEFSFLQKKLESQLAQAESELNIAKAQLRWSIESSEITDICLEVAEASGVEIIEISSTDLTSVDLGGISFSVLTLTAKAEGDISDLIDFILELSGQFPTAVEETIEIDVENQLASIRLRIHTYEGD